MKRQSRSIKSVIAMILIFSTLVTCGPSSIIAFAETSDSLAITRLTSDEKQGVILHAWNWSFNTVTDNLNAIKEAGYTSVQVSPIQVNKDLYGEYKTSDKWWILYQPAGFQIGNKQLGSEDEFKSMCEAAHKKGIKIIVDTIVNHMGNNGDPNIPAKEVEQIDNRLSFSNKEYWHVDNNGKLNVISDYNNRYDVTHNGVGLPDLNTYNKNLQEIIKGYLQKCLNDGADGFRFDTAKHVELPIDSDDVRSDFWPSVLDGLTISEESKALSGGDNKPFVYGEVLQGGADNISGYASYFDVTASNYGSDIRSTVGVGESAGTNLGKNFDNIKSYHVPTGINSSQLVTWVESHDTYANDSGESTAMTDEQIKNGWAIVGARKDSTPLYFNRPAGRKKLQGNIGDAGNDNWRDPDVVAINKFHSEMEGLDERLTKISDNVIMIERGTGSNASKKGIVIVNLGDNEFSLQNQDINLNDGVYNNCGTVGGSFTVSNNKVSGSINKGITVLYAEGTPEAAIITPKVSIDKEDCSFDTNSLALTLNVENGIKTSYSIDGVDKGIFSNGDVITIGENSVLDSKIVVKLSATSVSGKTVSETYTYIKRDPNAKATVYFQKTDGWQIPYAYVYNDLGEKYNNNSWPGIKMNKIGDKLYKLEITGFTDAKVMFNDWFYGNNKTDAQEISSNGMKIYDANKTWMDTPAIPEDSNVSGDDIIDGTTKVFFKKPDAAEWNYDDVNIYFYGKVGPSWPGVPMIKVEGTTNLYMYTLPTGLEGSNVIFNAHGGNIQVPGHNEAGFTAPANSSMIYADGQWKEYTKGISKAYFRKPAEWGEPNIYVFTNEGEFKEVNGWPGVKMIKVPGTETLYSYTLPQNFGNATVIFNDKIPGSNTGSQTDNLVLPFETSKIYDEKTKLLRDFTADDFKEPEKPAVASQGVTKVYFKNTENWSNVKIYYWQDGSPSVEWPGVSMVDEGNDLFSYNLPKGYENAKVIFNNGNGKQTVDLSTKPGSTMEFVSAGLNSEGKIEGELVSKSKVYFMNKDNWKNVKIYYWIGGENNTWPGVSMVDEGSGLYSYTMPAGFEEANIIFNNSSDKQTPDYQAQASKTLILDNGVMREFTTNDMPGSSKNTEEASNQEEVGSKVYVKIPDDWNGIPNIHYWNTSGGTTNWPGKQMKDEGNGIYSAIIPRSFGEVTIIINDGSNKLADKDGKNEFSVKDGSTIIFDGGEWKDYTMILPTPETPVNPEEPNKQVVSKIPTIIGTINTKTTNLHGTAGQNAEIVLSTNVVNQVTTSAGARIEIISTIEEKEIGTTKADENGNWSIKIPVQSKGTIIKITAKEEGKLEAYINITVIKKTSSRSNSNSSSRVTVNSEDTRIKASDYEVIRKAILNSVKPNITIDASSTSVIDKRLFEALGGKAGKTLTIVGKNNSWIFNGNNILTNGLINLDVTINSFSQYADMINSLVGGRDVIDLAFAYKGQLPGKALIKVDVDSKYNDKKLYMYSYNIENNRLTLISNDVIVKDGKAQLEVSKGADYILSEASVDGAVNEGWNKLSNGQWIFVKDEKNVTGWFKDKGLWYKFDQLGIMKTGWVNDNGIWYYLSNSGAMKTGWVNDNGTWYYLNSNGGMVSNTEIDGYKLNENGAWIEVI